MLMFRLPAPVKHRLFCFSSAHLALSGVGRRGGSCRAGVLSPGPPPLSCLQRGRESPGRGRDSLWEGREWGQRAQDDAPLRERLSPCTRPAFGLPRIPHPAFLTLFCSRGRPRELRVWLGECPREGNHVCPSFWPPESHTQPVGIIPKRQGEQRGRPG